MLKEGGVLECQSSETEECSPLHGTQLNNSGVSPFFYKKCQCRKPEFQGLNTTLYTFLQERQMVIQLCEEPRHFGQKWQPGMKRVAQKMSVIV